MNRKIALTLNVKAAHKGRRVDKVISEAFKEFSRSHLQNLIKEGAVKVNGKEVKPKYALLGNEKPVGTCLLICSGATGAISKVC